jgi:hypothetical protein
LRGKLCSDTLETGEKNFTGTVKAKSLLKSYKEEPSMLALRVIGKILSVPLIILTALVALAANAAINLSGIVLVPLLLVVGGYDIYFLIMMRWTDVFITTLIGGILFLVFFGAALIIALLEEARDGLIRFLHS